MVSPATTNVAVKVGTASSTSVYRARFCNAFDCVDALYIRNGWLTDGFALRCDR